MSTCTCVTGGPEPTGLWLGHSGLGSPAPSAITFDLTASHLLAGRI